MKKLMFLMAAAAMAASAQAAKTVYANYYMGDVYGNTGYGYVDPYYASVASSPVSFAVTNTPAGWKIADWLTAANETNIRVPSLCTSQQTSSSTYTWTDYASSTNALAVRFDPVSYSLNFDAAGGTAFPKAGPYLSTNEVRLAEYTGTLAGHSFDGWTNSYVTTAFDHTETFVGVDKFGLGNANTNITLYAKWTANSYTVTFDANGGSVTPSSKSVTYGQTYGTLPSPGWTGHTFTGWRFDGSTVTESTKVSATSNHVLTARWSVDTHDLTTACEGNGVVSPASTSTFPYGTSVTVTATPDPGWLFKNWKEDGSTANPRTVTMTSDLSLTAVFTVTVHKVTFKYRNANSQLVSSSQSVDHGASAVPPSDATVNKYPGHEFSHWDGSYSQVTEDRTVVAVYDANVYTVKFDANAAGVSGAMADQQFECGVEKALRLNKFSRPGTGYSFSSWNTASNGSGNAYSDGEPVSDLSLVNGGVVTLYAQWAPISYSIEFNGGTGSSGSMATIKSVAYDAEVTLPPNEFTKAGYTFLRWKCGGLEIADCATVSNLSTTAGATVTLVALWDEPYWLAFDANGGEGEMAAQRFVVGEPRALDACTFEKTGYTFCGWATNSADAAALKVAYADGAVVLDAAPEATTNTLYAVWSTNAYWVAFDPNGGEGDEMAPQCFVYGQEQNLSSNTYSRGELWRFAGWSNTVDGAVFADGAAVSNLCAVANATNTLVAVWFDNRTELSKAMHCTNLQWTNVVINAGGNPVSWRGRFEEGLGYNASGSCAEQKGNSTVALTACVTTNGLVSFYARNESDFEIQFDVGVNQYPDQLYVSGEYETISLPADGEWHKQTIPVDLSMYSSGYAEELYVHIVCFTIGMPAGAEPTIQIDQMTWTPVDAWDHGDDTAEGATLLAPTTTAQTHGPHTVSSLDPCDFFCIPMEAGKTYVFESTGSSNMYGELYDSVSADPSSRVAYGGGDGNFRIEYKSDADATYYLGVREFEGGSGSYSLKYSIKAAPTYTVTLGKNGGTGGDSYVTATYGAAMPTPRTAPTLPGWTFAGYWDTISVDEKGNPKGKQYYDASMKSVRNWDKAAPATLWAKWTNKVTFGKNGGAGGDNYVTCTKGQPMPKRTMPTKADYTFAGYWTTVNPGGVKYYNADGTSAHVWDKSGSVTLWAKWEKVVRVKVTLGKNGGTGGDDYVTATYGAAMPTPRIAPKLSGWTFAGYWDTISVDEKGNPKGKQYYDANMKSVRNWDKTAPATLWAKWTVRVTFGKNGGTGGDNYVTAIKGQPFPKRNMPKKTGYAFGGYWISSSSRTGQCYNADGTGTSSMKWSTGGTPTIWALWTAVSSFVELYGAAAGAADAGTALPAGLYSGVLADGSGAFWLILDEPVEGFSRTAYLYVVFEGGDMEAECTAEESDGILLLTTEGGEVFAFDPSSGELSR